MSPRLHRGPGSVNHGGQSCLTAGAARCDAVDMRWMLSILVAVASLAPDWVAAGDRPIAGTVVRLSAGNGSPAARRLTLPRDAGYDHRRTLRRPHRRGVALRVLVEPERRMPRSTSPCRRRTGRRSAGTPPGAGATWTKPAARAASARSSSSRDARGGKITVKAKGAAFPCAASAPQHTPFEVSLRLGAERYCASFGGTIVRNVAGTFTAKASPAPLTCAGTGVRVATLNVLHGLVCPSGTANCRLSDRIALLGQWILERKCPDVIALQEVWSSSPGVDVLSNVQSPARRGLSGRLSGRLPADVRRRRLGHPVALRGGLEPVARSLRSVPLRAARPARPSRRPARRVLDPSGVGIGPRLLAVRHLRDLPGGVRCRRRRDGSPVPGGPAREPRGRRARRRCAGLRRRRLQRAARLVRIRPARHRPGRRRHLPGCRECGVRSGDGCGLHVGADRRRADGHRSDARSG